jgi:hypothetical protein
VKILGWRPEGNRDGALLSQEREKPMRATPTLARARLLQFGALATKGAATSVPNEALDDGVIDSIPPESREPKPCCKVLGG